VNDFDAGAAVTHEETCKNLSMAKISLKRLVELCHRMGTGYRAGIDLRSIWERESQTGPPRHRIAVNHVVLRINRGEPLAEAMRAADGYFPELVCAVVEAGESGGRLERSFGLLARHYDLLLKFRREIATRLMWPVMELAGAFVIIGAMILAVGWATSLNPNAEPVDWLGFGWTTGQYFRAWVAFTLVFWGTIIALVWGSVRGWFGDLPMRIARRIPLLGRTIQIFSLARFAWVLGAVVEAGMNLIHGVRLAFRATRNYYYEQFEEPTARRLQEGSELAAALRKTEVFPTDFMTYLENGEIAGEIPESMERLAETYSDEASRNLTIISRVLFAIIFTVIALMIAGVVIALFMRYLNMLNSFQ
jgi:type IV pilus assembly protein PilC